MEDVRQDMEQEGGGFVTGALNWLSEAATAPKGFLSSAYAAVFLGPLGRTQQDAGPSLEQLAAETDADVVDRLSTLLLGTRQSTLKLIQRYPAVLDMDRADLMRRLVWLKGTFPGSDVSRMVELAPAPMLSGDWAHTAAQLEAAGTVLRAGLRGADVDLLFGEDPMILFEDVGDLAIGLERLRELWPDLTEAALANSEPLHLALAIRALAHRAPKGF